MIKKIAYLILFVLLVIQFFRIDKTNPTIATALEFTTVNNTPNGVKSILQGTCFDCHSNETKYPWYSNIQPIAWWMKNHINEGREELNFSEWADYSDKKKAKILEECMEMIQEKEMPPAYYAYMHSAAKLDDSKHKLLLDYFSGLQGRSIQVEQEQDND